MRRKNPSRVVWCNRGWQPLSYGFCPSEAAWHHEMKRLGVENEPYPTSTGHCAYFYNLKRTANCAIVTVANHTRRPIEVIGLLTHEAMHVWREIRNCIGERDPSAEFEAYSMQAITQELIAAYEATRGKLCHGR